MVLAKTLLWPRNTLVQLVQLTLLNCFKFCHYETEKNLLHVKRRLYTCHESLLSKTIVPQNGLGLLNLVTVMSNYY